MFQNEKLNLENCYFDKNKFSYLKKLKAFKAI